MELYNSKYAGIYKYTNQAKQIINDRNKKIRAFKELRAELERRKKNGE